MVDGADVTNTIMCRMREADIKKSVAFFTSDIELEGYIFSIEI
jgi:hypothetical protein